MHLFLAWPSLRLLTFLCQVKPLHLCFGPCLDACCWTEKKWYYNKLLKRTQLLEKLSLYTRKFKIFGCLYITSRIQSCSIQPIEILKVLYLNLYVWMNSFLLCIISSIYSPNKFDRFVCASRKKCFWFFFLILCKVLLWLFF